MTDVARRAYDTVADTYAARFTGTGTEGPLQRGFLDEFVDTAGGPIADLGCGTGRLTALLAERSPGKDVFGLDLSSGMIAAARRLHPKQRFGIANLTALPIAGGALGGAVLWYSLVHTPPAGLPRIAAELARVIRPGGLLLTGFHAASDTPHPDHAPDGTGGLYRNAPTAYGHDVPLDWYFPRPETLAGHLTAAGFTVTATLVVAPTGLEKAPQACVMARRTAEGAAVPAR